MLQVACLVLCNRRSFTAADFLQNLFHLLGPDERARVLVVRLDVLLDRRFQILHTAKPTSADPLASQFRKPPFHPVPPTRAPGREGEVKTRVRLEPWAHSGVLDCPLAGC